MISFSKKFLPFYTQKARLKIAYGGRNGAKSHSIATILLMMGYKQKKLIVCLREFQKNLEDSVYRLLSNKIREDDVLSAHYTILSDTIRGKNGTEFKFSGIKNARNFKSFEAADIAWIEEAQTISEESWMLVEPTIRIYGSEIWLSFNPDTQDDPAYKLVRNPLHYTDEEKQLTGVDVGQITLRINYFDNPLCPPAMIISARKMKEADFQLYMHVWEGECRQASDAVIFKDKWEVQDFEVIDSFGIPMMNGQVLDLFYGLDFGWVHETAITENFIYNNCIYINNEIVGREMDLDTITTRYLNEFKYNRYKVVYADSARPDLIEMLKYPRIGKEGQQLPGLNIEPAKKGAGSVESGITWMKNHRKIYIHPRCVHAIENFKKYSYKTDKNGIISTVINKINDDVCDSIRYSFTPIIGEDIYGIDWENPEFLKELHQGY